MPARSRTWIWALAAILVALALLVVLDLLEDPDSTPFDIVLNLLEELPLVLVTVGAVWLYQVWRRQREANQVVARDLAEARAQGEQWRRETRQHLEGLGAAIDAQFSRWNLSDAEREVALLLLKGLSIREVATLRTTSERTAREQARAVYAKAGLAGRAALSAYFLEDLLAPIGPAGLARQERSSR